MYLWQKSIVFVVMFSNWFYLEGYQGFKGDEFNVYRALRSINHLICSLLIMVISKYLVLHRSQIIVKTESRNSSHSRNFKRTGDDEKMPFLLNNYPKTKKENSEHVMVDLARNDDRNACKGGKNTGSTILLSCDPLGQKCQDIYMKSDNHASGSRYFSREHLSEPKTQSHAAH
jgi:hypothetical protein